MHLSFFWIVSEVHLASFTLTLTLSSNLLCSFIPLWLWAGCCSVWMNSWINVIDLELLSLVAYPASLQETISVLVRPKTWSFLQIVATAHWLAASIQGCTWDQPMRWGESIEAGSWFVPSWKAKKIIAGHCWIKPSTQKYLWTTAIINLSSCPSGSDCSTNNCNKQQCVYFTPRRPSCILFCCMFSLNNSDIMASWRVSILAVVSS